MGEDAKLIIIRGPSGSGKTTVAHKLFEQTKKPTVLIEQDYYRFIFKPAGGKINSKTIHKMIKDNVLAGLSDGYDVILEGIFNVKSYKETFSEIFDIHQTNNFIFYFDISFKETIKRHRTKPNKDEWSESNMVDWYHPNDHLGYDFEETISEDSSIEQTIQQIRSISKI